MWYLPKRYPDNNNADDKDKILIRYMQESLVLGWKLTISELFRWQLICY